MSFCQRAQVSSPEQKTLGSESPSRVFLQLLPVISSVPLLSPSLGFCPSDLGSLLEFQLFSASYAGSHDKSPYDSVLGSHSGPQALSLSVRGPQSAIACSQYGAAFAAQLKYAS